MTARATWSAGTTPTSECRYAPPSSGTTDRTPAVGRPGVGDRAVTEADDDTFRLFLGELTDGKRWQLLRTSGWEEFAERLSDLIIELSPRRRQALVMLLFALSERLVQPDSAASWIAGHDLDSDTGVEQMITWLRQFRPEA